MAWVRVNSSNIQKVKYDSGTSTLSIGFNSGYVYEYQDVPKGVYDSLLKSSSKGKFFHQHINKSYEYKKIM